MSGWKGSVTNGLGADISLPQSLKLESKSDRRDEIPGTIVRYDALAPRPEVLCSISCFYGNHIRWKNIRVYVQLLYTLIFNYAYSKGSLSTLTIICRCRPCALSTNETYKQKQLYKKACVYVGIEEQIFIQVGSKGKRRRKYNSSNALICKFFFFWLNFKRPETEHIKVG